MKSENTAHSVTHQTLIARVRNQHDEESWQEFTRYYKAYICAVIRNMNVVPDDLHDIAQNVLLGVWKRMPDFRYEPETCRFRTWLCTVIRNQVVNYCEKQSNYHRRVAELSNPSERAVMCLPEVEELAEQEWKKHITDLAWEHVQTQFDGKALESFELLLAGHDPDEVARRLDLTRSSVYVHRKRVKERMLREINRLNDELS